MRTRCVGTSAIRLEESPLGKGAPRSGGDRKCIVGPKICCANLGFFWAQPRKAAEPAGKPGSVVDSHSSRRSVTAALEQPTRRRRGPRHRLPIWPCSRWGLPCRSVAGLAVRSYRTVSPLPSCLRMLGRSALCCTFRRLAPPRRYLAPCPVEPGLSSAHRNATRLSGRLRQHHCRTHRRSPMFQQAAARADLPWMRTVWVNCWN